MPVITSPGISFQLSSASNPNPVTVISIGSLSYTGTVLMYDPQFAINSGTSASPNIIPFVTDPQAKIPNNAPVAYIRNLDTSAVITIMLGIPSNGGISSPGAATFSIAPGGFVLFFNPVNVIGKAGATPDSVGLGAQNNSVTLAPVTIWAFISTPSAASRVVYAEVLIAA